MELGEYRLDRSSIKSQVLVDFIAEFIGTDQGLELALNLEDQLGESDTMGQAFVVQPTSESTNEASCSGIAAREDEEEPTWILIVDDSSNLRGSGAGVILTDPDRLVLEQFFHSVSPRQITRQNTKCC